MQQHQHGEAFPPLAHFRSMFHSPTRDVIRNQTVKDT